MKASKFSDAQKAFILKQGADGVPVAEICRKAGISQATYFNWKKKYEGMTAAGDAAAEAARGREREAAEAGGRPVARPRDAAGRHPPKTLRPGRKRELVDACAAGVGRVDPAGLPGHRVGHLDLPLPLASTRPGRPRRLASRRSARRACATATGASTCCCGGRAGT